MAAKSGFQYYSVETDRYQDIKIKRLKKECGCIGLAVYDYILCEIYRVKGCFLEWDESTVFDVSEYLGLKESQVTEIVNYCCAVGLFDRGLLTSERVLTSSSIQLRFIDWSKKAKRVGFEVPEKLLILPEETVKLPEGGHKIHEDSDKVKKSKVKKSKVFPLPQNENPLPTENGKPPPVAPPPSGLYPDESYKSLALSELKVGSAIERVRLTSRKVVTAEQVQGLWEVFKELHFTGQKLYRTENDIFTHFSNWIKDQRFDDGIKKSTGGNHGSSAGAIKLAHSLAADIGLSGAGGTGDS